ncbi:hypothetical protein Ahy_A09g044619 [Arachis hypogaea]|uniref:Uncharacterized protein n=1 Tax=Arachis hypogaea TaxID=3818 RepID=A0A445BKG0_ARAHY|nr:hypothetical protein Ahy_A09g044619 [Arachis hypogaea]
MRHRELSQPPPTLGGTTSALLPLSISHGSGSSSDLDYTREKGLAVNDKQNEAITAASNELAKRKSDLEENLKLSHDLKVEQGAKLRGASRIIGVDKNPHKCEKGAKISPEIDLNIVFSPSTILGSLFVIVFVVAAAKAFGFTEVVDASSYQEPIAQTGVLPLFVPFAQASAAVLTAVLIGSLYYVAASPKGPLLIALQHIPLMLWHLFCNLARAVKI